jgi:hypothetical protein
MSGSGGDIEKCVKRFSCTLAEIAPATGLSLAACSRIRAGVMVSHPQHWQALVQLLGYVDAQYKEAGYERESTEKWGYEKLMAALREPLSEAEIEKLAAEGAAWSEDQAVEEALAVQSFPPASGPKLIQTLA